MFAGFPVRDEGGACKGFFAPRVFGEGRDLEEEEELEGGFMAAR